MRGDTDRGLPKVNTPKTGFLPGLSTASARGWESSQQRSVLGSIRAHLLKRPLRSNAARGFDTTLPGCWEERARYPRQASGLPNKHRSRPEKGLPLRRVISETSNFSRRKGSEEARDYHAGHALRADCYRNQTLATDSSG